jgi:hypothetical protein
MARKKVMGVGGAVEWVEVGKVGEVGEVGEGLTERRSKKEESSLGALWNVTVSPLLYF